MSASSLPSPPTTSASSQHPHSHRRSMSRSRSHSRSHHNNQLRSRRNPLLPSSQTQRTTKAFLLLLKSILLISSTLATLSTVSLASKAPHTPLWSYMILLKAVGQWVFWRCLGWRGFRKAFWSLWSCWGSRGRTLGGGGGGGGEIGKKRFSGIEEGSHLNGDANGGDGWSTGMSGADVSAGANGGGGAGGHLTWSAFRSFALPVGILGDSGLGGLVRGWAWTWVGVETVGGVEVFASPLATLLLPLFSLPLPSPLLQLFLPVLTFQFGLILLPLAIYTTSTSLQTSSTPLYSPTTTTTTTHPAILLVSTLLSQTLHLIIQKKWMTCGTVGPIGTLYHSSTVSLVSSFVISMLQTYRFARGPAATISPGMRNPNGQGQEGWWARSREGIMVDLENTLGARRGLNRSDIFWKVLGREVGWWLVCGLVKEIVEVMVLAMDSGTGTAPADGGAGPEQGQGVGDSVEEGERSERSERDRERADGLSSSSSPVTMSSGSGSSSGYHCPTSTTTTTTTTTNGGSSSKGILSVTLLSIPRGLLVLLFTWLYSSPLATRGDPGIRMGGIFELSFGYVIGCAGLLLVDEDFSGVLGSIFGRGQGKGGSTVLALNFDWSGRKGVGYNALLPSSSRGTETEDEEIQLNSTKEGKEGDRDEDRERDRDRGNVGYDYRPAGDEKRRRNDDGSDSSFSSTGDGRGGGGGGFGSSTSSQALVMGSGYSNLPFKTRTIVLLVSFVPFALFVLRHSVFEVSHSPFGRWSRGAIESAVSSITGPTVQLPPSLDLVYAYYDEPLTKFNEEINKVVTSPSVSRRSPRIIIYLKNPKANATEVGMAVGADEVVRLPNLGREGGTYLKHIMRLYNESLAFDVQQRLGFGVGASPFLLPNSLSSSPSPYLQSLSTAMTFPIPTNHSDVSFALPPPLFGRFDWRANRPSHPSRMSASLGFADHTMFLQPHLAWNWIGEPRLNILDDKTGYLSLGPYFQSDCGDDLETKSEMPRMKEIYATFREELCPPTKQLISYAAQFTVSRDRILANAYNKYKRLDDMIEAPKGHWLHGEGAWWKYHGEPGPTNPYLGHAVERSWPTVFACTDPKIAEQCPDTTSERELCQCFDP